jgi:hypothetical protein
MPTRLLLLVIVAGLSAAATLGCSQRDAGEAEEPAQDVEAQSRNIGDQYVRGILGAGNKAQGTVAITSIEKAVEMYQLQHGKNPPSLDTLVTEGFLPQKPKAPPGKQFQYDAAAGTVKLVDA